MKRLKRFSAVLLALVLLLSDVPTVNAFSRDKHDKMTEEILFKNFKIIENDPDILDEIEALESAAYLTIDQFNNEGQDSLDILKDFGVKNLPKLSDIDFSAGSEHRKYTHLDWNAEDKDLYFGENLERWKIRKDILLNTTEKIFDFDGNESQKDSFCALIYYIHMFGDRIKAIDDRKDYSEDELIPLVSVTDKHDIIYELINNFKILFESQKHTFKYIHLETKLLYYRTRIKWLIKHHTKDEMTEEYFEKYSEYVGKIKEVLECNLPEMLKDEDFFSEVFYRKD